MRKPSLFILGVQKCGTTTVADLLAQQPEIFVPSVKETYFFCDESYYAKGEEWYLKEFYASKFTRSALYLCDATPFYLASEQAIQRLRQYTANDARYIVCLRDPVARAYSAYWHQRRLGNEPLDFESALACEEERITQAKANGGRWWRHAYFEVGRYGSQLERAFSQLGRERFLILMEQDLQDLDQLQQRLRTWLGLPQRSASVRIHRANVSSLPRSVLIQKLITRRNPLKSLIRMILPREIRSYLGRQLLNINLRPYSYPVMKEQTRLMLYRRYADEYAILDHLGIALPPSWMGVR